MDQYRDRPIEDHYHKRSRSRDKRDIERKDVKKRRSRSPRHGHHHNDHEKLKAARLPFKSHHLHKQDFESYRALFAEYLDLQKNLMLDDLDEHEAKGRWKSFLNKWNRGELAEGWYDPAMKQKADGRSNAGSEVPRSRSAGRQVANPREEQPGDKEDDDDEFGPVLPRSGSNRRPGPAIPNFQDLQQKREQQDEDREARIADLRYERKQDRNLQKERLEEMAPRAEPGSRERQLEKKRETAMTNRSFAEAKEAGTEEVADSDLLGDDGGDAYKAKIRAMERQKNERELRKEEVLRARAAEREEKMAEHRRKEAKTMEMLKEIAAQRFGSGG